MKRFLILALLSIIGGVRALPSETSAPEKKPSEPYGPIVKLIYGYMVKKQLLKQKLTQAAKAAQAS